jgi:radical SAM family uncharacterized protein/radical SAM-linked protein
MNDMNCNACLSARIESELLPYVEKPLRYVGNELNIVRKNLSDVALHGVFCFPDMYDIGMSHHGLQILYHIVNRNPRWALSRAFHPWSDAERIMRERSIPLWSLEYGTAISNAHWLGFSLQYELQYTGLVNMLDLAGIPLLSRERTGGDWPLVVAGGPCMVNPEPLAQFVDVVAVGDGEETVVRLCHVLDNAVSSDAPRSAILDALAVVPGLYLPERYDTHKSGTFIVPASAGDKHVHAAKVPELKAADYPDRPLVPLIDVVHHRLAVEVLRGCTRGCRFCSAGMHYRPVRERDVNDIRRQIEVSIGESGWDEVGLLSLSTADYGALSTLLQSLRTLKETSHLSFSLPSTRVDALSTTQLDELQAISHATAMTIAPEAGSERLRGVINKGFTDDDILRMTSMLMERNVQTLKLYFMIGLPTETDEDISAIVSLVERVAAIVRGTSPRRMVNVAISPFSPKPWTPFQWEAMDAPDVLLSKGTSIKRNLASLKNVRVSYRNPELTLLETFIARGDRRVGDVVAEAWRLGARLDGWDEMFNMDTWRTAAEQCGVCFGDYTGAIALDQVLPWHVINMGVSENCLRMEREFAVAGMPTDDCRSGSCSACGACTAVSRRLVDERTPERPRQEKQQSIVFGRGRVSSDTATPAQGRRFYRLAYRKGPAVRFLGHRDMSNAILRALAAAKVPVEYTQGFRPHPRVAFGPPLPLGVAGERELFDVTATRPLAADLRSINRYLPADLEIVEMREQPTKPVAVSAQTSAALLRFEWIGQERPDMRAALQGFLERKQVVVEIIKKGVSKPRDIRPLVYRAEMLDDDSGFEALVANEAGRTCSPAHLISALLPSQSLYNFFVTRVRTYRACDGGLEPL